MKSFNIFEHKNPQKALQNCIFSQPKRGRGLIQTLSNHLRISQPQMSQLFRGSKKYTVENAVAIAQYFKWTNEETNYWIALVEWDRAADYITKKYFENKMNEAKNRAQQIADSFGVHYELDDKDKAEFYSSWIYSAVRLYCSLDNGKSKADVFKAFSELYYDEVNKALTFLIKTGLIKKTDDFFVLGESKTFVKRGSPFLKSHVTNWRLRAVDRINQITDDEIIFSAPLSISKKGLSLLRKDLQNLISSLSQNLESYGNAEEVVCLNIDLFKAI